jgi:hypothetical protein
MVWFDANASAFVAEFVALAREVVAAAGSNGS